MKFNENIDLHDGDTLRLGVDPGLCFVFNESTPKPPEMLQSNTTAVSSVFRPEEESLEEAAVVLVDSLVQPYFNHTTTFVKHEELPIDLSTAGGISFPQVSTQVRLFFFLFG